MAEPVTLINSFEVSGDKAAHWQTAEDFSAAIRSPGFLESAAGLVAYRPHASLYRVVRT
ncbi:MAG TPA: hypothetical protein VJT16_17360 [Streptosporangiaceae bacterium]|nr:hypothetical protein [Streptosporangiaceae bacterium]